MIMTHQKTIVAATIAAFVVATPTAWAETTAVDKAPESAAELATADQTERATSLAAMHFEYHLQSMGSTTGTRIERDGPDLSRAVTVIHGDGVRIEFRR